MGAGAHATQCSQQLPVRRRLGNLFHMTHSLFTIIGPTSKSGLRLWTEN